MEAQARLVKGGESAGHLDPSDSSCVNEEVVVLTEWLEGAEESTSMYLSLVKICTDMVSLMTWYSFDTFVLGLAACISQ